MARAVVAVLCVSWLTILLACGGATAPGTAKPSAATSYGEADDAKTQADVKRFGKEAVRERRKYPLDAEFNRDTAAVKTPGGRWVAAGTVKAANSLGAKLTQEWRAHYT